MRTRRKDSIGGGAMHGIESFEPVGPGRFRVVLLAPWGQGLPAEMLVTTARGWGDREEAQDPRWSAFPVGPAVVAFRLLGATPPTSGVRSRRWAAAVERN